VQKQKDKVVVLGLGNLLLGDEGAGIHVINKLKKIKLPPNVEIIDGGTSGFKLISIFNEHKNDRFLIIDAIAVPHALNPFKKIFDGNNNETVKKIREELQMPATRILETEKENKQKEKHEEFTRINNKGDIYVVPLDYLYKICPTSYDNKELISFHQVGLIDILSLLRKTLNIKIKGYLIGINIFRPNKSSETVNLKYSLKLSDSIRKKIPDIIDIVLKHV